MRVFSVDDLRRVGISRSTLYRWLKQGVISSPFKSPSRRVFLTEKHLEEILKFYLSKNDREVVEKITKLLKGEYYA